MSAAYNTPKRNQRQSANQRANALGDRADYPKDEGNRPFAPSPFQFVHRFQPTFILHITPSPEKQVRRRQISTIDSRIRANPRKSVSNALLYATLPLCPYIPENSLDEKLNMRYNTY